MFIKCLLLIIKKVIYIMKFINEVFVYRWTFDLYDLNGDGVITKDEMEDIVASVNIIFYSFFLTWLHFGHF